MNSGQVDRFVHQRLPPADQWPEILPLACIPQTGPLNCVEHLLERHIAAGKGSAPACIGEEGPWTYGALNACACRIANVLVNQYNVVSGNRVLIRSGNKPIVVAIWLALQKIGAVAVTTMPLLRAGELSRMIEISHPVVAICDEPLKAELGAAILAVNTACAQITFDGNAGELETLIEAQPDTFTTFATHADDVALIGFTSGTTGNPKATIHFHRDILSICHVLCTHILRPTPDDVFIGTAPLAFTFGLGGLMLFPLFAGASTVLLPQYSPQELLAAIEKYQASICFTVPTFYQRMTREIANNECRRLRMAISSGEALPLPVRDAWKNKSGVDLVEVLGSTELLHAFIGAREEDAKPGYIGRALPGYEAAVLDDDGYQLPPGELGRLALKGPTGCRYLNDDRQMVYVQAGWNITGDTCSMDVDGYVKYHARFDDMIISAGYNISGTEVENALLSHNNVSECAVIAAPDEQRGQIVSAFIVLKTSANDENGMTLQLQEHVRTQIAPYKYPRRITYVQSLPRNEAGKIQRFRLRA